MIDIEPNEIQKLLNLVAAKITTHNEFKKAYDEQLAFDFNIFNFNRPGENKISEILAYFLDPRQSHGQTDKFLRKFMKLFFNVDEKHFSYKTFNIECEKCIVNNRRLDIYMQIDDHHIAIENKIWAVDQHKQLYDYSQYLASLRSSKFTLLYLNPYGDEPASHSIAKAEIKTLSEKGHLKTISYADNIFPLLDDWISVCKADNVTYFIKQFKQFLNSEIIGNDTLTMTNILEKLIYENRDATEELVHAYNEIDKNRTQLFSLICNSLTENVQLYGNKILNTEQFRNGPNQLVYKHALSSGNNRYWVQLLKNKLDFEMYCYLQDNNDPTFDDYVKSSISIYKLEQSNDPLVTIAIFDNEIRKAIKIIKEYESAYSELSAD